MFKISSYFEFGCCLERQCRRKHFLSDGILIHRHISSHFDKEVRSKQPTNVSENILTRFAALCHYVSNKSSYIYWSA